MKPILFTNKARNGKIARLPRNVRNQLNDRLDNGEPAAVILPWLNASPEAQTVLSVYFDAAPITKQNLAHWRNGGFQEWLQRRLDSNDHVDLVDEAQEHAAHPGTLLVAKHVCTLLVTQLAQAARQATAQIADPIARCRHLQDLLQTLCRVRQQDYLFGRFGIQREQFDADYPVPEPQPVPPPERGCPVRCNDKVAAGVNPDQRPAVGDHTRPACSFPRPAENLVPTNSAPAPTSAPPANSANAFAPAPLERGSVSRSNDETSPAPISSNASNVAPPRPTTTPAASLPSTPVQVSPTKSNDDTSYLSTHMEQFPAPKPYVPDPDPAKEAYNRWYRMNRGVEPFDYDLLQKLYAAGPEKET